MATNSQLLAVFKELERRIAAIDIRQGGPKGSRGPLGPKGSKGDDGKEGALGASGPKGNTGPQGAIGASGRDGKEGARGKPGITGLTGSQGHTGAAGLHGNHGRDGVDGISITDVQIDFDGRLTVHLSDGRDIDAGEIPLSRDGDTIIYSSGGRIGGSGSGGGGGAHNDLSGIQGGSLNEYYHLTAAEWTQVVDWVLNGLPIFTGLGTSGVVPDPITEVNAFLRDDGTWVIPTNTNTQYTAGAGLLLTGTVFSNTAPDQTVSLTGAGITVVTGTYPNFTITSTEVPFSPTTFTGAGTTGYVPDPITETGKTLKDDGTWATPITDHTNLTSIGVNTHAQIDTHIASVTNPHNTTYQNIGGTQPAPIAHTHDASDIVSGTMADARIAQSNVTQHQAALAIAGSQISGTIDGGTF